MKGMFECAINVTFNVCEFQSRFQIPKTERSFIKIKLFHSICVTNTGFYDSILLFDIKNI